MHWYPHFLTDYASKTLHLTMLQHGAYRLLIDAYYLHGRPLPADRKMLYRICKAMTRDERQAIDFVVNQFFDEKEGFLQNSRCENVLRKQKNISEKRSESAKIKHLASANAHASAVHSESKSKTESELIDCTNPERESERVSAREENQELKICVSEYNAIAERSGLPKCQILSDQRKSSLEARLKDCGGIEGWRHALKLLEQSDFLLGKKSDWKASFDFLLQKKSFIKLMEGSYANYTAPAQRSKKPDQFAEAMNVAKGIVEKRRN